MARSLHLLSRDATRIDDRVKPGGDQHLVRQDEEVGKSRRCRSQNRQNGEKRSNGDHYERLRSECEVGRGCR
jgi:hypothetical protein